MNKITFFVLAVIYFEVTTSLRTYTIKRSASDLKNILASYADSADEDSVRPIKRIKSLPKSRPPTPLKPTRSLSRPQPVSSKSTPPTSKSKKMKVDEKTFYVTKGKVIEGSSCTGEIKVNGVVAYVDENLKQGLVRVEKIDDDLCVNRNPVLKPNPAKRNVEISDVKIDTDQVTKFKITVLDNNNNNFNGGNNNIGNVTINGKRTNSNRYSGSMFGGPIFGGINNSNNNFNNGGGIEYEDNVNGSMTFF